MGRGGRGRKGETAALWEGLGRPAWGENGHRNEAAGKSPPLVRCHRKVAAYLQAGAPSQNPRGHTPALMKIAHLSPAGVRVFFVVVTPPPPLPAPRALGPTVFPGVAHKMAP